MSDEEYSGRLLQATLSVFPDLYFLVERDGTIVGYQGGPSGTPYVPPDAFLGRTLLEVLPREVAAPYQEAVVRTLETGQTQRHEYRLDHPDGRRWYEGRLVPFEGTSVLIIVRDVSDLKRAEEQREQAAVQALEAQHLKTVGVIAGGVAHDFNNLLGVILGNVSLGALELEPKHAAAPFLEQVREAAERAADLTRQLLALAGRGALEIRPLDLSAEIAHLADLLRASIPRTMRVQLDLAQNLPATAADEAQLHQLVMNLVINAAEAYADSSGTISVITERVEIDEATRERRFSASSLGSGPAVVLTVRDEGCGMDDDTRGRLFEPFFTTKPGGRGLGLPAVMGIVRAYGAALEIESAPGEGSTFRVFLPATEAPAHAGASALPKDLIGSGVVLVVDDEPALRSTTHKMLNTLGYDVIEATDGAEACTVFGQYRQEIAVVLLDLTMPVMGGEEACRRMLGVDPNVRVIIMSGYHKTEIAENLTATGRVLALRKPFSLSRLGVAMKAAFGA